MKLLKYEKSKLSESQLHSWDVIENGNTEKIGIWLINPLEWSVIDYISGRPEGSYQNEPVQVYREMLEKSGCGIVDQWVPENPLTMGICGYEADSKMRGTATTGNRNVVLDGIEIKEPESVVEHLEKILLPKIKEDIVKFDHQQRISAILNSEFTIQKQLGDKMLKTGYDFLLFPVLRYSLYGYENYLMAVALYPEVIEKDFQLQADFAYLNNRAAAEAYQLGNLPPLYRLDHDMADSRNILIDIKLLDRIWLPHFARALKPMLNTDVKLIWHSDGNLMDMYPRLLEVGISGFQGFQYECGMDYVKICRMKTIDKNEPFIIAGISVTNTLPFGSREDVRKEMDFLVENAPSNGFVLGASSSITPGTPLDNIKAMIEGFQYYKSRGRR